MCGMGLEREQKRERERNEMKKKDGNNLEIQHDRHRKESRIDQGPLL